MARYSQVLRTLEWEEPTFLGPRPPPGMLVCQYCPTTLGVRLENSRTAYAQPSLNRYDRLLYEAEGTLPPDPNADIPLCRECAEEHHANWDEQWTEYYRSQR